MIYDLIIIGADVAGLTAGIYAGRKRINTLILTKKLGGQSLFSGNIENYPGFLKTSGSELISKMKEQVEQVGVPIEEGQEVKSILKNEDIFVVKSDKEYKAKSIIVASGSHWKPLGIPGEDKFIGKGVSVCSTCDAPFFENKKVAVIGGGNAGLGGVHDLFKYADKIYLLEITEKLTGDKIFQDRLKESGKVEIITKAKIVEIKGAGKVESLIYEDLSTSAKGFGETKELKVDGVFINIGQIPNSNFVEGFLELNNYKEVVIDHKTNATSQNGIFAAGDVTDAKYKQSIIAAGQGAKAVLSACEYLSSSH